MFRACNKGFQISFDNGYTVSVMFGYNNYCANRRDETIRNAPETTSPNAEFAVFETDNPRSYVYADTPDGGYNGGWASPEKVAAATDAVAKAEAGKSESLREQLAVIFQ